MTEAKDIKSELGQFNIGVTALAVIHLEYRLNVER